MSMDARIQIVPYEPKFYTAFRRLNLEWLDHYHLTESHDLLVLEDPEGTILDRGGFIWLALDGDEAVGSAALMRTGENEFELAKMAVGPGYRGKGISRILIETCIAKARETGAKMLSLFSNHQLIAAISLYEKYGFKHVPLGNSPFETADVRMELLL
jgi:putative acetyltransferase